LTALLYSIIALILLYCLYFGSRTARASSSAANFLDANFNLPSWVMLFCLPGLIIVGLGIERQLLLIGQFGLQANHVSVGIVLAAITAMLVWNRFWLINRIFGIITPIDALAIYYKSNALRVILLGLTLLYAFPFTANILSSMAEVLEKATDGIMPRTVNIWLFSFALAITAILGGWRGVIFGVAMQSILLVSLVPAVTLVGELAFEEPGFPKVPIAVAEGVFWDKIPGVIQNAQGIGKSIPTGGIYTTVGIASSILALLGIVLNPSALLLAQTVRSINCLGISAIWTTGVVLSGTFLLMLPLLVVRISDNWTDFYTKLFDFAPLAACSFLLLQIIGPLLLVSFFVTGGVIIFIKDLVALYVFPNLSADQRCLSARISLGFAFFFVGMLASFAPYISAILSTIVLPLTVQILPAIVGIMFLRRVSGGAVLAGFALGSLIVIFTEPPGLLLFEALFLDLPWGRWPLTIHSAAWGLFFNLILVLCVTFTANTSGNWLQRDQVHEAIQINIGKSGPAKALLWSLFLTWGFLAYGPGAILGNTFFTKPIFTAIEIQLGIPSIWVWQILFWLLGVVMIWWVSFRVGFGRGLSSELQTFKYLEVEQRRTPKWMENSLTRLYGKATKLQKKSRINRIDFPKKSTNSSGSRNF